MALTASDMCARTGAHILYCVPLFIPFSFLLAFKKKYALQHVYQSACYEKVFIFRVKNPLIYLVCML